MSYSQAPRSIGRHRVIAVLGQGGMAEVYLTVVRGPAGFHKLQVVKQIKPHLAEGPEYVEMFLDEARLAARLSHPNVVQVHEVIEDGQGYFMSMEYLDGQPFDRVLRRPPDARQLTLSQKVRVLCEVLAGLHHAHEARGFDGSPLGVVHRDVTPHNVFVTYEGQVKVVDFGIAKAAGSLAETRTGMLKGKIAYMAPEQAQGSAVDRRADLFSVGLMLWECLTDSRPWRGLTDIQILSRLGSGRIPDVLEVNPQAPAALVEVVRRSAAVQRDDRYATAADMAADLEAWFEATGERASPRDIGRVVAEMFHERRAEMTALIEAHLRGDQGGQVAPPATSRSGLWVGSDRGASFDGAAAVPLPTMSGPMAELPTRSDDEAASAVRSRSEGSAQGVHATAVASGTPPATASNTTSDGASVTHASVPSVIDERPAPEPRGLTLRAGVMIAGGSLLAFVASGVAMMRAGEQRGQHDASPRGEVAPLTAPASTLAELTLGATPADARLFLDDVPVGTNPFRGKLPRDGAIHRVRAEAPGFAARSEIVTMTDDVRVHLSLDAAPPSPTISAAPTAGHAAPTQQPTRQPTATGPAPSKPAPGPERKGDDGADAPKKPAPKRQLDSADPWK